MSSQKKKTPAEELVDSLLNEVEDADTHASLSAFALEDEESGDLKATTLGHAPEVADDDQQLAGLVDVDPTTVGTTMSFEGLLKNKKSNPNDRTEVKTVVATKTEVKTQVHNLSSPFDAKTSLGDEFSSEEGSPYEATRIGTPPQPEENQHTELGELQLEPMADKVVDLKSLDLAEEPPQALVIENLDLNLNLNLNPTKVVEPATEAISLFSSPPELPLNLSASSSLVDENLKTQFIPLEKPSENLSLVHLGADSQVATVAVDGHQLISLDEPKSTETRSRAANDHDGTVAVSAYQVKKEENLEGKVKVSVGKTSRSSASGFASWGSGVDSNLSQAENLRMAQEKILELENENERLRRQNEELIAASEILKERSDLMTAQLTEYKNDREGLEQSFKNEMTLLKNHIARKDAELRKAQFKVEELESRLKFDLKKIRVRERELENRLELVRAEKNAISKNKDEQILDLRRKMDVVQMEVDSYRQKCIELNKQIESSQDSFKRTTRALRLAMANLELQEENKGQLKKAE